MNSIEDRKPGKYGFSSVVHHPPQPPKTFTNAGKEVRGFFGADTAIEQGTGEGASQARPQAQDGAWWIVQLTAALHRFISLPDEATYGGYLEQLRQYRAAVEAGACRPVNLTR